MISGISDRRTFAEIRARGVHVRTSDLRMRFLPTAEQDRELLEHHVAYSISRKVGNAVTRNRIRRRLRSLFANVLAEQPEALSAAVVVALPGTADCTYAELEEQVSKLIEKAEKSTELPR